MSGGKTANVFHTVYGRPLALPNVTEPTKDDQLLEPGSAKISKVSLQSQEKKKNNNNSFPCVSRQKWFLPFWILGSSPRRIEHFLLLPLRNISYGMFKQSASPGIWRDFKMTGHGRRDAKDYKRVREICPGTETPERPYSESVQLGFTSFNLEVPTLCLIESQRIWH